MTYKKLFPIEYNNKRFMIFLDENNRRTFLEINSKDEYEYPNLEDFIALNKMFNNKDPFICYSIPKFKFKECVKAAKNGVLSLLTVITVINSIPSALATTSEVSVQNDSSVTVTIDSPQSEKQEIYIEDLEDLNKYLGELDVTKEMVIEAIDNNQYMPKKYKRVAKDLLNTMTDRYPNTNLRIFYENVKTLNVFEYTYEEFREKFPYAPGGAAQYNCRFNTISTIDYMDNETLSHELYHAFNSLYFDLGDKAIVRYNQNNGLNESMTDIGIGGKSGYIFTRLVTTYLTTLVDYTVEDFNAKGVQDLLNKLKAKFPDIDVDYINESLNTYNDNCIAQNKSIPIDEMEDLVKELFEMCLKEANINSGYKPFNNFAKMFFNAKDPNLVFKYFKIYNKHMKEIGYPNIISESDILAKYDTYQNADGIGTSDNEVYPIARKNDEEGYLKINPDGSTNEILISSGVEFKSISSLMSATIFEYFDIFGSSEYWYKVNEDSGYISFHKIKPIPIYNDGKFLLNAMPRDLSIQIGFNGDKIGFIITNENGEVIYQTDESLTNISNKVSFDDYICLMPSVYITKVDLDDILNLKHLKNFQRLYSNNNFDNLSIEGNQLSIKNENPSLTNEENTETAAKDIVIEQENVISIYDKETLVAECRLSDLFLEVGETKDKKIGYMLINKNGIIIYQSDSEISNLSNPIDFAKYVGNPLSTIYLENYLNEDYLKVFQTETKAINNVEIENKQVKIDASPRIIITNNVNGRDINQIYRLSKCKVYLSNGIIIIGGDGILPQDVQIDNEINLEDVLNRYEIITEGIPQYQLSLEELTEMIYNYLYENIEMGR